MTQETPCSGYIGDAPPAPRGAQPLLDVSQLAVSVFFRDKTPTPILRDVNLTLGRSQTVCVIGQSGSGKSTLVHAIAGIFPSPNIRQTSGRIRVCDREITSDSTNAIVGGLLGVVFQDPWSTLTPVYTCGDQVGELLRVHRHLTKMQAKTMVLEIFRQVGLSEPETVFRRYPHELSGGMCQRVGIAMAIAPQPQVLIADEPTTALDPTVQDTILNLLQRLQADLGIGILLVTHDLTVASRMADQLVVLQSGTVVEHGPIRDVFSAPKHPYTANLMSNFSYFSLPS